MFSRSSIKRSGKKYLDGWCLVLGGRWEVGGIDMQISYQAGACSLEVSKGHFTISQCLASPYKGLLSLLKVPKA